jgi:hypothetical protein
MAESWLCTLTPDGVPCQRYSIRRDCGLSKSLLGSVNHGQETSSQNPHFAPFAHFLKIQVKIWASGIFVFKTLALLRKPTRFSKTCFAPGAVHPSKEGSPYCLARQGLTLVCSSSPPAGSVASSEMWLLPRVVDE